MRDERADVMPSGTAVVKLHEPVRVNNPSYINIYFKQVDIYIYIGIYIYIYIFIYYTKAPDFIIYPDSRHVLNPTFSWPTVLSPPRLGCRCVGRCCSSPWPPATARLAS